MGTFPTRGRDIVPVFIHRARVFSFLLDILDISSSSIYLFINILKLICFLYSFVLYLFITILNLFVYKFAFKDPTFPGAYMSYPWLFFHFLSSFLLSFFNYVFCICILCCWCIFCDFLHYVYTLQCSCSLLVVVFPDSVSPQNFPRLQMVYHELCSAP